MQGFLIVSIKGGIAVAVMVATVPVVPVIKIAYGLSDALLKSWSLKNVKVYVASS